MTTIYDIVVRQQLYLEAVKTWHANDFSRVLRDMNREFRDALSKVEKPSLDLITRKRMNELLTQIRAIQQKLFKDFYERQKLNLEAYAQVERDLSVEAYEKFTGSKLEDEEDNDLIPLLPFALFAKKNVDDLYKRIAREPMPANGQTVAELSEGFFSNAANRTRQQLEMLRANKATIADALAAIVGTKDAAYRNGFFYKIYNEYAGLITTTVQHIGTMIKSGLQSIFWQRYIWISIIDSRTTDICTRRDQKTFIYGIGPLPPAHYRCRSTTLPVDSTVEDAKAHPGELTAWLRAQPEAVQNDILGYVKATRLRAGRLNIDEKSVTAGMPPLSAKDYKSKGGLITA